MRILIILIVVCYSINSYAYENECYQSFDENKAIEIAESHVSILGEHFSNEYLTTASDVYKNDCRWIVKFKRATKEIVAPSHATVYVDMLTGEAMWIPSK